MFCWSTSMITLGGPGFIRGGSEARRIGRSRDAVFLSTKEVTALWWRGGLWNSRWPLGASVLQPQGTESCLQPGGLRKDPESQRTVQLWLNTLISSCGTLGRGPSHCCTWELWENKWLCSYIIMQYSEQRLMNTLLCLSRHESPVLLEPGDSALPTLRQ